MANPTVGSIEFLTIGFPGKVPGEKVQTYTRPGVAGVAVEKQGVKGDPARWAAFRDVLTAAAAKAHIEACISLKGSIVTVVDDTGESWTEIVIVECMPRGQVRKIEAAVGGVESGSAQYVVEVEFTSIDKRASVA